MSSGESDIGDFIDFIDRINPDISRFYTRNDQESSFYALTDEKFKAHYRFTKLFVHEVLLPISPPNRRETDNRGLPISPLASTLILLRFYATGSMQVSSVV